jgi:hypothetical protein
MSLHSSSVLVKLTVRYWDGFKKDRSVSERVDTVFQTAGGAGNYNKRLLDKTVLAPIYRICNRLRYDHKFYTIPWCYDGVDLLPSKLYFTYTQAMRLHKDALDVEVGNLVQQYPIHTANQAQKLGAMYNSEDYPARDELRTRFGVAFQFFPVPQEGHFVVELEKRESDKLKADLTRVLNDAQSEAKKKLYVRIIEALDHLHDRLHDPANIFRDSMVENFVQLVSIVEGLNIFNDPLLDEVGAELKNLVYLDAGVLRKNPQMRAHVAEVVFDVANKLRNR